MKKALDRFAFIFALLSISYLINGCLPSATGLINQIGRADDGTSIVIYENGVEFLPVGIKDDVVLAIIGEPVVENDDNCTSELDGVICKIEQASSSVYLNVSGNNLAVWASWLENGELIARFKIVGQQ
jgi:hypothetical protein